MYKGLGFQRREWYSHATVCVELSVSVVRGKQATGPALSSMPYSVYGQFAGTWASKCVGRGAPGVSGEPSHGRIEFEVASEGDFVLVVLIGVMAGASAGLVFLFISEVHVNLVRNSGTWPVISTGSPGMEGVASLFNINLRRFSSRSNRFGQFV